MVLNLSKYSPVINTSDVTEEILNSIKSNFNNDDKVVVDFQNIRSMATFCARQIFGTLYISLTPKIFFDRIVFQNTSDDLKSIIKIGIEDALDSEEK